MTRNPYVTFSDFPTLRHSVLAYMDILGYAELIRASEVKGTQEETLRALHSALRKGRKWFDDRDLSKEMREFVKTDQYALKAFTDNIVIGWPVRGDAESEFGDAFFRLGIFQFEMVLCGATIRVRTRDNQDEKSLAGRFRGFCPGFDPLGGDFGPI